MNTAIKIGIQTGQLNSKQVRMCIALAELIIVTREEEI
jgi:hypothetical protein